MTLARTGPLAWEIRGGDLLRVDKSYGDGRWQTHVDTIGDPSIGACRELIRKGLLSGCEPARITVSAARGLREA